jgi:hypothetical protein
MCERTTAKVDEVGNCKHVNILRTKSFVCRKHYTPRIACSDCESWRTKMLQILLRAWLPFLIKFACQMQYPLTLPKPVHRILKDVIISAAFILEQYTSKTSYVTICSEVTFSRNQTCFSKTSVILWHFRFSRQPVWRWNSSGMLGHGVSYKQTDVSEMLNASTIWTMTLEAIHTSETSVNLYETTRSQIPEDSRFHFCHLHGQSCLITCFTSFFI